MGRIEQLYFRWLIQMVCSPYEIETYSMVLMNLHDTEFISEMEMDDNLIDNCYSMRDRFLDDNRLIADLDLPISILEIMVYISVEIEDTIMDNDAYGDRTGLWFWEMMDSLGLKNINNIKYDESVVNDILEKFIYHKYNKSGKGGLFTVCKSRYNATTESIWNQAMIFLTDYAKKNGEII